MMASFNNLPSVGDGTFATLEFDRFELGPKKILKVEHPVETTCEWRDLLMGQGSQHFFLAVTKEEFNNMKGVDMTVPNKLDGSLRSSNQWYQLIINTTAGDAVRTLACHEPRSCDNKWTGIETGISPAFLGSPRGQHPHADE